MKCEESLVNDYHIHNLHTCDGRLPDDGFGKSKTASQWRNASEANKSENRSFLEFSPCI